MNMKAILEGTKVVPCDDILKWGEWMERPDRLLWKDKVGDILVSTVFLGLDHGFGGQPIWFETMTFGDDLERMERYSTYEEAINGHKKVLEAVQKELDGLVKVPNEN